MRKTGPQVLRSADHALRVVLLVTARGKITVSEVAAELSVGVSTAHRLLSTCKHAGFVRQDRTGGPYTIGPAVHELALATNAAVSLKDAAAPVLQDLRAAVVVAAPLSRLGTGPELASLAPAVVDAAAKIQRRLRGAPAR